MTIDLALILVLGTFFTGVVWLIAALKARFGPTETETETETESRTSVFTVFVEYCRAFFPVFLIVLIIRSFLYEPYKIPSASMVPTLLIGDFILVSKYSYGMRLPVIHTKILETGAPQRGDVAVFRLPKDPSVNYIKRVVGLPGDELRYRDDQLWINDELVPLKMNGPYIDPDSDDAILGEEVLNNVRHFVLHSSAAHRRPGSINDFNFTVPDGHFFMMGDNRDNSRDSRYLNEVGYVPEGNLVGKAVRIWLNMGDLKRIGDPIQ